MWLIRALVGALLTTQYMLVAGYSREETIRYLALTLERANLYLDILGDDNTNARLVREARHAFLERELHDKHN